MPYSHAPNDLSFTALSAAYVQDEAPLVQRLIQTVALSARDREVIAKTATQFVETLRHPSNQHTRHTNSNAAFAGQARRGHLERSSRGETDSGETRRGWTGLL